ncbi:hypothetical protein B0H15DRAFT_912536 [Mycena belliarum]|uniref:Transmembrane protein n=1 Tax=Mycena belliarum TaxID=1033014 RepID=A0AAD6TZP9_9AGAR|nr:hypothetical protein B0H15DRAFT_912536 [Mycena belliae]
MATPSSTSTPRQIVVDDTDTTSIHYGDSAQWIHADPRDLPRQGVLGPPYNNTSHATRTNTDSSFSFNFNGASLAIRGSIIVSTIDNVTDPTWECFIDGKEISYKDNTFQYAENNYDLCHGTVPPGSHTLTVQVHSKKQPFYLDSVTYTPGGDVVPAAAVVLYTHLDTAIRYSPKANWTDVSGQHVTQLTNAVVDLSFHGTSATLFGDHLGTYPYGSSWATYAIDGGEAVNFTVTNSPQSYNYILFSTPVLSDGPHNLTITHGGNENLAPLFVHGFYVTSGSSRLESAAGTSSLALGPSMSLKASTPTSSNSGIPARERPSAGPIIGALVGGILLLVGLGAVAVWLRRRRWRGTVTPYSDPVTHFHARFRVRDRMKPQVETLASPVPVVLQHEDSGMRRLGAPRSPQIPEIVEVPPGYSSI